MREEVELRLVFLDRTEGEGVESLPLRPICVEEGIDCVLFLLELLNRLLFIGVLELLFRLALLEEEEGVEEKPLSELLCLWEPL